MNKLNLYDRILKLFGTKITFEWCVLGCTIGRHSWTVNLEKCRNGTPVSSGWFLEVIKCSSKESAELLCSNLSKVADEYNKDKGYA